MRLMAGQGTGVVCSSVALLAMASIPHGMAFGNAGDRVVSEFAQRFHVVAAEPDRAQEWMLEEGARRAPWYLAEAERFYAEGLNQTGHSRTHLHHLAVQQVLGALDLAMHLPSILLGAGKVMLALADLRTPGADVIRDDGFPNALSLFAAASRADGGLLAELRTWLGEGEILLGGEAPAPSKEVRKAASAHVSQWHADGSVPDLSLKFLHKSGCTTCDMEEADARSSNNEAMASFQERVLFPSHLIHTNLKAHLPEGFIEWLADMSLAKFQQFSKAALAQIPDLKPEQLNPGFFAHQKKNDFVLNDPRERAWWPELYEHSAEFPLLRKVLRESLLEFVKRRGLAAPGPDGDDGHVTVLWTQVYPGVEPGMNGTRNGLHTHEQTIASCVFYLQTDGSASGPMVFLDPRGAAPMDDWERDKSEYDVQPRAPFHRREYFFPEPGDMVCFDPWLVHMVPSQRSNVTRVVWAANLQPPANLDSWLRTAAAV